MESKFKLRSLIYCIVDLYFGWFVLGMGCMLMELVVRVKLIVLGDWLKGGYNIWFWVVGDDSVVNGLFLVLLRWLSLFLMEIFLIWYLVCVRK